MKKRVAKKIFSLLMSLALIVSLIPSTAVTAEATSAVTGKFDKAGVFTDSKGTFSYSGRDAYWMQGYYVSYTNGGVFKIGPISENGSAIRKYRVNGEVAYCIEHGVVADETVTMTPKEMKKSLLETVYSNEDLDYIIRNMSLCLLYGRQEDSKISTLKNELGFKDSSYYDKDKKYTLDDWEIATRQLIHETQQRFRDENFNKLETNGLKYEKAEHSGSCSSSCGTSYISSSHYRKPIAGRAAMDIYNYMAKLIKDHIQLSTVMGSMDNEAPLEVTLTRSETDKTLWLSEKLPVTDKRAVAVKVVKSDGSEYEKTYKLKLKTDENGKKYYQYEVRMSEENVLPNTEKTFTVKKKIDYFKEVPDDMLIWECKDGSGNHVQAFATGSCDPVERYVKFSLSEETGGGGEETVTTTDRPEAEYFPQIEITVEKEDLNPGFDNDKNTGMGDAALSATYVLLRDGKEVDRVTLDEYGNPEVLTDIPWKSISELKKTESGTTRTHTIPGDPPTDHGCYESPTRVDYDGKVTYTVREIAPDGRFIEPDSGVRSMTVTYNGYTKDTRSYGCQAENWTDMIYTVKTTITDGITFTNQNGTITAVEERIEAEADTFINDCYRGKLTLSKSLENSDVFSERKSGLGSGEKTSVNSKWKLSLNSGGFEDSPYVRFVKEADLANGTAVYRVVRDSYGASNETEDMLIGSNGDLLIYDIPYGEYTMSEVAADDVSYVLENFQVRIDEHDKAYSLTEENDDRYDYNVRDKKKTNVIKIEKTNAETGKKVRAAGTKFYIRYMGDPLLDDPAKSKNYGRLLPNAEDITKDGPYTWEADENGEITIPYELEWGIYRIEEWKMPAGYFAGEYALGAGGKLSASTHDYGNISEGQTKAEAKDSYENVTGITDFSKEKPVYEDKIYELNEIANYYSFTVEKQEMHEDGNFATKVSADRNISAADESYDSSDYPYVSYYKAVAMPNNMTKGKIEINKSGEVLTGFKKESKNGKTVYTPIYESTDKLKGAVFGIYAAEDITLGEAAGGIGIYDAKTNEKITIPTLKSTHESNPLEKVSGTLSKFFTGSAATYDTGETLVGEGKLRYLNDRSESEEAKNRTVYVTPEQKDTRYSYTYEKTEAGLNICYDVAVTMNYQAGGRNITDIKITKTSTVGDGYSVEIPSTLPTGTVGDKSLDPLENYLGEKEETSDEKVSSFTAADMTYTYEAAGKIEVDKDGNEVDLSDIGVSRYIEKDYIIHTLRAEDLKTEERVVTPAGTDEGGNLTAEVKETKTLYEWNNSCELVSKTVGKPAVIKKADGSYMVDTSGYYMKGEVTYERAYIASDESGNVLKPYTIPESYSLEAFTGDLEEDAHYILVSKTDSESGKTVYKVLLSDLSWQDCDENASFKKKLVQSYTARYIQEKEDAKGFSFTWDGFSVASFVDNEKEEAVTTITKQQTGISPLIELGAGYEKEIKGLDTIFSAKRAKAPVYFVTEDNIRIEVIYQGGVMIASLDIPQSAVDKDFENVVPSLMYRDGESDMIIDWYKELSPDKPIAKGNPLSGIEWIAERIESAKTGEAESYRVEFTSSLTSENPFKIKLSDGSTISLYADSAESGNGVGVLEIEAVASTIRASKASLVDTVTTDEDGKAVSKLLYLGKYIVREISAPEGYVTADKEYEVELTYENQYVPLVWESITAENEYMKAEIELSKVFETAYESGNYAANGGAVFGLYAAEEISATVPKDSYIEKIAKNTLIDVIHIDANGKAKFEKKLPFGTYYIKEISTLSTHKIDEKPYYLAICETKEGVSSPCELSYEADGISVNIVLDKYGQATVTVKTEVRYPMPTMKIGERSISLSENLTEDGLKVSASDDYTTVKVTAKDNTPLTITLANGKLLTVTVRGNSFEYTVDGVSGTYVPSVSYTGYYAAYSHEFTQDAKADFSAETETVSFKTAEAAASTIDVSLTHTPLTKTENVWTDTNGNGVKDEGEETSLTSGVLDKDGKQSYAHQAVFTVKNALGENVIEGDITRTSGKTVATESVSDPSGEVTIAAGEIISLTDKEGRNISVLLDNEGKLKADAADTLSGSLKEGLPGASVNGVDDSENVELVKSVTLARADHAAKSLQIKINSTDELNVSPIKNEHLKVDTPSYTPGGGSTYRFELTKNDIETGETLEGAVFELYGSHEDENGNLVRDDEPLYKNLVTDSVGSVKVTLPSAGTYYYHETKAPSGYICDGDYYEFTVGKDGKLVATVTMVNEKEKQEEAIAEKKSKEVQKTLPNSEQEDVESEVPKTGDERAYEVYMLIFLLSIALLMKICYHMSKA